jgi:anti-sigma factor RsiW
MTCEEAALLLDAFVDRELDAGHTRAVESHLRDCPRCAARVRELRTMHRALAAPALRYEAPASLRSRIDSVLPKPSTPHVTTSRRGLLQGFAMGSVFSAAAATGLVLLVGRPSEHRDMLADVVGAHLRSMQADHLTDVLSTDQHTVKPWFNGRLDVAPPVVDLTAQGFTLLGGRLDYFDRPVAAIVYRRRVHVINLFVTPRRESAGASKMELQGFNVVRWSWSDLDFWVVSDINAEELQEFEDKYLAALRTGPT